MRLEVKFIADVHKVKGVEYLDRSTGRQATSWRLILDYGDDTGEIKCTEEVVKHVKRHHRYEFLAVTDPSLKETNFRITGLLSNFGIPDDDEPDTVIDSDTYTQQSLDLRETRGQGVTVQNAAAVYPDVSGNVDETLEEKTSGDDSNGKKKGSK